MKDVVKTRFSGVLFYVLLFVSSLIFGQMPVPYKVIVGETEVTALLDGVLPVDAEQLFFTNEPGKPTQLLENVFIKNPVEVSMNAYLVKTSGKLILVDTGAGELFGNAGGKLLQSLKQIAVAPEDITDILLTHIHADHSGGLVMKGKIIFPNAIIHVNKAETDFWLNEKNAKKAEEKAMGASPRTFSNAKEMLDPYLKAGKVKTFEGIKQEIVPNIYTLPTAGHTPGHTVYVLESKGEKMYFWGDLVHMEGLQFVEPALENHFDVDHKSGIENRKKYYDDAAKSNYLIGASHISYPGIGRVKKEGSRYVWYPVPFSLTGRTR
ncbi:MBL fold metallo-hydrolase [Elizabethkingia anophelis]|nr:MBL fold metallo-hydrolase [Elizabethkingia anophelis]MCT3812265.1 MBL fold metallo-hydrolase [Elizabethkingia anophelis]MCT3819362.1 MBL fold metallo-hydrolase [Elizabethkingia anophelis]MCT3941746.1 MBL fold metallo-hydrolase [Elizabethkingia anophelis]MCT4194504.1 MBL fold metallo-hydrolase [Elizabethkingia anophelis]